MDSLLHLRAKVHLIIMSEPDVVYADDFSVSGVAVYMLILVAFVLSFQKVREWRRDIKRTNRRSAMEEFMVSLGLCEIAES